MINPLNTSILLLATLVLFYHQPQFKAELKASALPSPQANLVASGKRVHVWTTGSKTALQALTSSLPAISAPVLTKLTSQTQTP